MGVRVSDSVKIGPLRIRLSVPVGKRGRKWVSVGTRTPFGWTSVSRPVGARRRRRQP